MTYASNPTTRRDLLRALGFGAGALAVGGPTFLTACSSDSVTETAAAGASSTTSATTPSSAAAALG